MADPLAKPRNPYLIQSVVHSAQVLEAFAPGETLRLRDVMARTGLSKGIAFRLLYTLEHCGMLEKPGKNLYRRTTSMRVRHKYRIGYGAQGADDRFGQEVSQSIEWAAQQTELVDLVSLDNRYRAKTAQRNVETFIRERVDLVIEFQTDEAVAPMISSRLRSAGIPLIAVEIPHPGAVYFGANNYEAGLLAGRSLGRWAKQEWDGHVDEILLLELPRAGAIPQSRLTGLVEGLREFWRGSRLPPVTRLDGQGRFQDSWQAARRYLRRTSAKRVLIGGVNDPSVLGALRAFEEAGRLEGCAAVGQGGSPEGRMELRHPSRLIGTVAYFPEKYGEALIRLALDVLQNKPVPPAVFVHHHLLTPRNIDHYYPNDPLLERLGT